ncbi:hypothetical protein MIND_01157300 [Mycena indigotica]|uniref:Uncharacterized protein n=1 Tax=Mycena indigotica TaxID=2126181 RepID=A0A8H6S3N6_9AGAR|nr:uncharacterized protein MIND_01157300 [Mycena indigotica]KAF7292595.1 hypothetical protein MIND_01157300 [Mycena indigotica]
MSSAFLAPVSAASTLVSGVSVPYDVLDLILRAAPDFDTLHAAVGVCSTWHTVFVSARQSILVAVAGNIVGPALPQAVRYLRYPYPEKTPNDWSGIEGQENDEDSVTESDTEDDEDSATPAKRKPQTPKHPPYAEDKPLGILTPEERFKLARNAQLVEDLALWFIEKSSHPTPLTPSQFHRFSRAAYRVMLFCELFYLPLNLDDIDSMEDNEPGIIAKIHTARLAHLRDYTASDLFAIHSVVDLMYLLINDVLSDPADFSRLKDICLATGPAVILAAHNQKSEQPFEDALEPEVMTSEEDNQLFTGFLTASLGARLKELDKTLPISVWGAILDEDPVVLAAASNCAQCGIAAELWHKANWARLIAVDFCALLPGQLNENDIEAAPLVELVMGPTAASRLGAEKLIEGLYDDASLRAPNSEFSLWTKDEKLCMACMHRFVGAHLVGWLYKQKVANGWRPKQNCWYGWNCRTQVHKPDHAKTMNHLCAPTR